MNCAHIVILQLCFIAAPCAKLSRKQLEQRLQAMQTLIFQDTQIMKEGINKNAEGIKELVEGIQKNEGIINNIESKINGLSDLLHETISIVKNPDVPTTKSKDVNTSALHKNPKTHISQSDIKRLQNAFKELKMHSLFVQVNTFNQLETFLEKQNLFMNNISLYLEKCESKTKSYICENLETLIDTLNPRAKCNDESVNKTTSAEYSQILMKAETILKEVIKGHSIITDSLSAITSRQADSEDTIPASCFKVVYEKELDVANDHGNNSCFNINAQPGKKVTFHCGNKNIRIADAVVTEIAVEGRVEVRYNNHWGTVCSANNYFGVKNANVACRAAGFARGVTGYNVPKGSGLIWLSHISCKGEELDLFDCGSVFGIGSSVCGHSLDVAVKCFWLP